MPWHGGTGWNGALDDDVHTLKIEDLVRFCKKVGWISNMRNSTTVKFLINYIFFSGNLSDLEGNPRMSPKVMMNDIVESLNNLESTKLEIKNRLSSFKHITTSHYMCAK